MTSRPLIVRLRNWVGDVILGVPALKLLASHDYQLQLVGKGWAAALLAGEGWPIHTRAGGAWARVRQLRGLRAAARARDPAFDERDNAMVLTTSFSSALDMRLAGMHAVGYSQEARGFLLSRSVPIVYGGHALVAYWDLACRFLGITQAAPREIGLQLASADVAQADALVRSRGLGSNFVVICPFTGGTFEKLDKAWPQFPQFARALLATGKQVIACPGPGEEDLVREHYPGVISIEGVELGTYGAILQRAALLVSNDSGPGHLAAAVGASVLSVLGPTRPEQWAPWGPTATIVQRQQPLGGIAWPEIDEVMQRVSALVGSA